MISKQEIMALAAELQLQAHVVEKDYALGWFLAGISAHPLIGPHWLSTITTTRSGSEPVLTTV